MAIDNATRLAINSVIDQGKVDAFNAASGAAPIGLAVARGFVHFVFEDVQQVADTVKEARRILVSNYINLKNDRANTLARWPEANVAGYDAAIVALESAYPFLTGGS
jgi:hypothetical protein